MLIEVLYSTGFTKGMQFVVVSLTWKYPHLSGVKIEVVVGK